jgi:3-hydroxyisobutyrate dehydrogenase-like beta-hydroxyacid dehydrogenase
MRIGFIGFGEAAQAFTASLREAGLTEFSAYDIKFDGGTAGPEAESARALSVDVARSNQAVAEKSDWVFSAVTASSSLDAAEATAPHLDGRHVFFDINSCSPERKRESMRAVGRGGAVYVDTAVMAPVHPAGHSTPILLAGRIDETVIAEFARLGFCFDVVGPNAGEATAVKMIRSLFVKGLEALTVEVLLAARQADCWDRVLHSLSASYPGLQWDRFAAYQLERCTRHGIRRAAEMRESARTLDELGRRGALAAAVADTQQYLGDLGFRVAGGDLAAEVDRLLDRLRPPGKAA